MSSVNLPNSIRRRTDIRMPPVSELGYDINLYGIKAKRFPGKYWGNTLFEVSDKYIYSDYYTALGVQKLINQGLCREQIEQIYPTKPVYYPNHTDVDVLGHSNKYKSREKLDYTPYLSMPHKYSYYVLPDVSELQKNNIYGL